MDKTLHITCTRATADEVETKLLELDKSATLEIADTPKMVGLVEGLSIVASLSTVAASSFVIWAEVERRRGKEIEVKENEKPNVEDDTKKSEG